MQTILKGGVGNQLFQYAFGLTQAKKLNTELKINKYILDVNPFKYTPYDCELVHFSGIKEEIISDAVGITVMSPNLNIIEEGKNQLSEIKEDSYLDGYWQNESFFDTIKGELRQKLVFNKDVFYKIRQDMEIIKNHNCISISLHVRRGDYLNGDFFVDLSQSDYYQKSIEYMKSKFPHIVFCVFSNDIEWAKQFLGFDNQDAIFFSNSTIEDLCLISLCKHNITANSSYSWWGAWLNANPDKIIIQPKRWYGKKDIEDLKLEGSILL